MRAVLIPFLAGAVVLIGAGPAAPPDYPVEYIKADELKALLDRGTRADIFDVRTWPEYAELHIRGAHSMPLRTVAERAGEVPRTGLVVFY